MSNERLKNALHQAGLTPEQLADQVQADPKSIARWLSGTPPYPRNRARVAAAVGVPAHELWPDLVQATTPAPAAAEASASAGADADLDAMYLDAYKPEFPDLVELLDSATTTIDIVDLTLHDLLADDRIRNVLAVKAGTGVEIRVLVSDPDSVHLLAKEHEHADRGDLAQMPRLGRMVEQSIAYLQPLLAHDTTQVRLFTTALDSAITRVDDRMLVALHLYGAPPAMRPILDLTRRSDRGLFARFAHHFDLIWDDTATSLKPDAERYLDPDQHPDRYQVNPVRTPERYGGLGVTPPPPPAATPSTAPKSSRRRRRS